MKGPSSPIPLTVSVRNWVAVTFENGHFVVRYSASTGKRRAWRGRWAGELFRCVDAWEYSGILHIKIEYIAQCIARSDKFEAIVATDLLSLNLIFHCFFLWAFHEFAQLAREIIKSHLQGSVMVHLTAPIPGKASPTCTAGLSPPLVLFFLGAVK